jgi:hypothetical protein
MTNIELLNAARVAVGRNKPPSLISAFVHWEPLSARITLIYLTRSPPDTEIRETCELALADLIAEFSDIELADGDVLHETQALPIIGMQRVYPSRPN